MLRDLLEYIFAEARAGDNQAPKAVDLGRGRVLHYLYGECTEHQLEAPWELRVADSIESLSLLLDQFCGEKPTCYVNEKGCELLLDDASRVEAVRMQFEDSLQLRAFEMLRQGVTQRKMVRILRSTFNGCVCVEDAVGMFRRLEFTNESAAESGVQSHMSESMGRSVEKAVRTNGTEDIPETLDVSFPLFTIPHDVPSMVHFSVAVDIDFDNEKVCLIPVGDQFERARQDVLQSIVDRLRALLTVCTVVMGSRARA